MRAIATILALLSLATCAFAQGTVDFRNTASTLISANGVPMPVSGSEQFIFALFLGPSTTVLASGQSASLDDPVFQVVGAYNTNSAAAAGRILTKSTLPVSESQGYGPGSTVDFIVRGWSANAGATWSEALASWNNGTPIVPMYIGSSTVANNYVLAGGQLPATAIFGPATYQVLGFNMPFIPEPSALALAVLGGAVLWASARRGK